MSSSEARPRLIGGRPLAVVPWAGCAGALIVVVVGLWIKQTAGGLGAPLPPFVMEWNPQLYSLAVVSVAALIAAVALVPMIVERVRPGLVFAASMYVLALALGLSLNLAHEGVRGLWAVFGTGRHASYEGRYEYLTGLPVLVHGIPYYLRHFASLFYYLPTHARGNPPGPLIALDLLGIRSGAAMAALCIGVGALTAPLAYDLGRTIGGEQRGRISGVLTAFAPSMLLFGVTSADYAFAALGLGAACLLVRRSRVALIAGGVALALASFFSWLLLAIPAWAALLALRRHGWRAALAVGGVSVIAVVAFNALLALIYGYDPVSALRATESVYRLGISATRPYSFWLFGSPAAWTVMIGLPITWLALRSLTAGDPAAISLWALILVASVMGFTKAETERIWLPFVPLACVAAAAAVPAGRLRPIVVVLAVQAFAVEWLFFTIW